MTSSPEPPRQAKGRGRPRTADGQAVPYDLVDRLLVHGEQALTPDGHVLVRYPSIRELARRYGVSHAVIGRFARRHRCAERRAEADADRAALETARIAREAASDGRDDITLDDPADRRTDAFIAQERLYGTTTHAVAPPAPARPADPLPAPAEEVPVPVAGRRGLRLPLEVRSRLDTLLVCGEDVVTPDGKTESLRFPSYKEIGARLGLPESTVAEYSTRNNCRRRREEYKLQLAQNVEERLRDLRGERLALSIDTILNVLGEYAEQFRQALLRGEVPVRNPGDFDRMMRLWLLVTGGPDARVEVNGTFTLEAVQSRHAELASRFRDVTPREAGVDDAQLVQIGPVPPPSGSGDDAAPAPTAPPDLAIKDDSLTTVTE